MGTKAVSVALLFILALIVSPALAMSDKEKAAAIADIKRIYLEGAFAGRERLIRPALAKAFAYICPDTGCIEVVDRVSLRLQWSKGKFVSPSEASRSIKRADDEFLIYIVFMADEAQRDLSYLRFPPVKGWTVDASVSPRCSVWRYRAGDEIKKAVIAVDATAGARANLACSLTSMVVATGGVMKNDYSTFEKFFESADNKEFLNTERGLARAIFLQLWDGTRPGMSRAEVEAALAKFPFDDLLKQ